MHLDTVVVITPVSLAAVLAALHCLAGAVPAFTQISYGAGPRTDRAPFGAEEVMALLCTQGVLQLETKMCEDM